MAARFPRWRLYLKSSRRRERLLFLSRLAELWRDFPAKSKKIIFNFNKEVFDFETCTTFFIRESLRENSRTKCQSLAFFITVIWAFIIENNCKIPSPCDNFVATKEGGTKFDSLYNCLDKIK